MCMLGTILILAWTTQIDVIFICSPSGKYNCSRRVSHIMSKLIIIIIIIRRLSKLSTIGSHHINSIMCPEILCSQHLYIAAVYLCITGDINCAEKSRPSLKQEAGLPRGASCIFEGGSVNRSKKNTALVISVIIQNSLNVCELVKEIVQSYSSL